jgi:hypothetical protein
MGIASGFSLLVQLAVLAWVSHAGGTFRDYFQLTLWILGLFAAVSLIASFLASQKQA